MSLRPRFESPRKCPMSPGLRCRSCVGQHSWRGWGWGGWSLDFREVTVVHNWNVPSWVLGNTVHGEVSKWKPSIIKFSKEAVCHENLVALGCPWPLYTEGARYWRSWEHCRSLSREQAEGRKQNPFCNVFLVPSSDKAGKGKNIYRIQIHFTEQSEKGEFGLELKDNNLHNQHRKQCFKGYPCICIITYHLMFSYIHSQTWN